MFRKTASVLGFLAIVGLNAQRAESTALSQSTYTQLAPPASAAQPESVDLTTEGTIDWAHWGRNTNFPNGFDRKKNVTMISDATVAVTAGRTDRFDSYPISCKWNDGDPTANNAGTQSGLYINGDLSSYKFTVTTPQAGTYRLRVYVSAYHDRDADGETIGRIRFDLTDGVRSRSQQSTLLRAVLGRDSGYYETTYTTDNANAKLAVTLTEVSNIDSTTANFGLLAATLSTPPAPQPQPCVEPPVSRQPAERYSWPSQPGKPYQPQWAPPSSPNSWSNIGSPVTGDGTVVAVCEPYPPAGPGQLHRVLCLPEGVDCVGSALFVDPADWLTWPSQPGLTYQVQWAPAMSPSVWTNVGGPVVASGRAADLSRRLCLAVKAQRETDKEGEQERAPGSQGPPCRAFPTDP
jgi:hypothetical protein